MKACFVCATEWQAEWQQCGHCNTALTALEKLAGLTEHPRFLFGSVREEKPEPIPVNVRKPAPKPAPKPRPVQKAVAKPLATPPPVAEEDIFSKEHPVLDIDTLTKPTVPERRTILVLTTLTDLVFCLGLNYLVFKLILWVSDRGLIPLVNLSLIPLLFVLLGFTALYFWMFHASFDKTLGGIVAEKILAQLKKRGS